MAAEFRFSLLCPDYRSRQIYACSTNAAAAEEIEFAAAIDPLRKWSVHCAGPPSSAGWLVGMTIKKRDAAPLDWARRHPFAPLCPG